MAAERGNWFAQQNLAKAYGDEAHFWGHDHLPNYTLSYKWYDISAEVHGECIDRMPPAKGDVAQSSSPETNSWQVQQRDEIAEKMTPHEIEVAQAQSRDWVKARHSIVCALMRWTVTEVSKAAKKLTPKQRLRQLADAIPSDSETHAIMLALESQQHAFGDYAIAIICAGVVERALEAVILTRFVGLNKDECNGLFSYNCNGPLNDLSARIKVAYALGIFGPKTRDDLEHIRQIRNAFAHSLNLLRFEAAEVSEICALLHTATTIKLMDRMMLAVGEPESPRGRYVETTLTLAGRLTGTIATAKNVRLTTRGAEIIGNKGLP